ncbi:MAG: hypothetical protein LBS18_00690, partial [Clostridiales bacterium]|nr:hypothetical protein [Clostridiales bacterium]
MNTWMRKNKKSRQIMALMLVLLLVLGQMAISLAGSSLDPNETAATSEGEPQAAEPAQQPPAEQAQGGALDPNAGEQGAAALAVLNPYELGGASQAAPEATQQNGEPVQAAGAAEGEGEGEGQMSLMQGLGSPGMQTLGGIISGLPTGILAAVEVDVTSTGDLGHNSAVTILGSVRDQGKTVDGVQVPAITSGLSLTITFPAYAVPNANATNSENLQTWLNELKSQGVITQDSGYISGSNQCVLRFTGTTNNGSLLNINFSISLLVDITNYTGENDQHVIMQFDQDGTVWQIQSEGGIHIDPGVPEGSYGVSKRPFGDNFTHLANGNYVITNKNNPVQYRIGLNLPTLTTDQQSIVITDTMSSGMVLCDSAGNIVTPATARTALVDESGGLLQMPNITVELPNNAPQGFIITITGPFAGGQYVFYYYTKVEGSPSTINNSMKVVLNTGGDPVELYDNVEIVVSQSSLLLARKYIKNGSNLVENIALSEDAGGNLPDVQFVAGLRQISDGTTKEPADYVYATDTLNGAFTFKSADPTSTDSGMNPFPFVLTQSGNVVTIKKNSVAEILKNGNYYLPFTVGVNKTTLMPGQSASNTIMSSTVRVYRDAKLHVRKIWTPGAVGTSPVRGATITFILSTSRTSTASAYRVGLVTANVAGSGNTTATINFNYLTTTLRDGTSTYYLHEQVGSGSDYSNVSPIAISITKNTADGSVTISDVNTDGSGSAGERTVEITNTPDDFVGSITLNKRRAGTTTLISGAVFQLLDSTGGVVKLAVNGDHLVPSASGGDTFTVNQTAVIRNLPYAAYSLKEISAPAGYVLNAATQAVTLSKTNKNPEITVDNTYYSSGTVAITKVDEKGVAVSGVVFTLYKDQTLQG